MQQADVVPVIIVGGGPVGLTSSILLSLRDIPHILFERHPDTSIHPKACGINQRTSEIFRAIGVEDEVCQQAAPMPIAGRTAWYTSLGEDGREIISRDAWGGGQYADEYATFSPSRYCILPQIRLEPILKRRAIELNPEGVVFNAEVLDVRNENDRVRVKVNFRGKSANSNSAEFSTQYVLIADGGRKFTEQLGIKWLGEPNLFDMVTAHIRSPLRSFHPDPRNFMTWFINPDMGGSTRTGYLYQIGPWSSNSPDEDEWVFACGVIESDPRQFDEPTMLDRLRGVVGIPDLPAKLISLSHWNVNAVYAEKWRLGRVFLVGDSAHKVPPWGALGMNSGIQDAQNLVWKLQLALQDKGKYDRLLDTYETERLDIGRRVGLTSLHNMRSHSNVMDAALGITVDQSAQKNREELASFFDPSHPDYSKKRAAVKRAQDTLDIEFKAPGFEVGWFYPSVDISGEGGDTHGGQQNADGSLNSHYYFPSTIPGHHLPHVVLRKTNETVPIRDLLKLNKLVLFTEELRPEVLQDRRIHVEIVGPQGWQDTSGDWQRLCQGAAVLVRPDGIVAWRGQLKDWTFASWTKLIDTVLLASH
ncbi:hypothetical protein NA57DRAFT_82271 [Rhizodiscina lignyota]|uniref:FAD-binding domain-containing protein n=1 Tax=Rhizodiscina lignyota TaxID=1504668 RepID=A0A9P4I3Y8_9PEZI|nr:hypothetical protein NA57DRAFT_82271 [Rhizodiscina lignyota]